MLSLPTFEYSEPMTEDLKRRWLILRAENADQKAVYRLRADRSADDLAILASIEWEYSEQDENGFPVPSLRESMDEFEATFDEITQAELVLVTTGMGLKEWVLYTRNFDAFMEEFNRLMRGKPRAPVNITCRADPDWQYWWGVRKHAKPQGPAS